MARGVKIDRVTLHRALWEKADRFGKVEIHQKTLADELGVTNVTVSLIIKELVEEERVRKVAAKKGNVGIYVIKDPTGFAHPFEDYEVPGIGIHRCLVCGELEQVGQHLL